MQTNLDTHSSFGDSRANLRRLAEFPWSWSPELDSSRSSDRHLVSRALLIATALDPYVKSAQQSLRRGIAFLLSPFAPLHLHSQDTGVTMTIFGFPKCAETSGIKTSRSRRRRSACRAHRDSHATASDESQLEAFCGRVT